MGLGRKQQNDRGYQASIKLNSYALLSSKLLKDYFLNLFLFMVYVCSVELQTL
jgi:hypothetical protein